MNSSRLKDLEEECRYLLDSKSRLDTKETGVHYLLHGQLHTDVFYQVFNALESGPIRERFGHLMNAKAKKSGIDSQKINVLLGPVLGAIPLVYAMQHFEEMEHTRAIFAERENIKLRYDQAEQLLSFLLQRKPEIEELAEKLKMPLEDVHQFSNFGELWALERNFILNPDEAVLIIDDVTTTFNTVRGVIFAAHRNCRMHNRDSEITGFGVLVDRRPLDAVPPEVFAPMLRYFCGLRIPLQTYTPEACDYCKQRVPLVKP